MECKNQDKSWFIYSRNSWIFDIQRLLILLCWNLLKLPPPPKKKQQKKKETCTHTYFKHQETTVTAVLKNVKSINSCLSLSTTCENGRKKSTSTWLIINSGNFPWGIWCRFVRIIYFAFQFGMASLFVRIHLHRIYGKFT